MFPGGGEVLLILFVVLLLFGGKELPRVARMMGKWSSTMRRSLNEVRREINRIGIEEEMKEAASAMKGNPIRGPRKPDNPTASRDPQPDADGEYVPPELPYPDAIEPQRRPDDPAPYKTPQTKTGESDSSHPESSSSSEPKPQD